MHDQSLREHLLYLLQGGGAHLGFAEAVADPATDLFAPIPHGSGQTILREALLAALPSRPIGGRSPGAGSLEGIRTFDENI